jgi:glycosyltransferase involved in cell wall biosynthesis
LDREGWAKRLGRGEKATQKVIDARQHKRRLPEGVTCVPKISVVVLNYNGSAVVLRCVRSVLGLDWPDLEVLVVDNASSDGSVEQIAEEFGGRVRVICRQVNSATAGRNEGFRAAQGEYVLSLDNDIVLHDPLVLHKAAAILERFQGVAALSFRIGSPENPDEPLREHWWHPVGLREGKGRCFYSDWFAEGAVLFRRELLSATGGYDEDLVQGFESVDLALRTLEAGFDILYCPKIGSVELRVRGLQHRIPGRINYLVLRNKLWTAWKDYPMVRGLYFGATRSAAGAIRAVRYGWTGLWLKAMADGILPPRVIRDKRAPVSASTWKRIRQIRKGQFCPESGLS